MARLDPFFDRLNHSPTSELLMETGAGALLQAPGAAPQKLIQQPLTTPQIIGAFSEIVPSELRPHFPRQGLTTFAYPAPSGPVQVRFEHAGDVVRATVTAGPPQEDLFGPGLDPATAAFLLAAVQAPEPTPPPSALAGEARKPPSTAPRRAAAGADYRVGPSGDPREAMEALLTLMLQRRASDLHLTSGCPPMLRIDGDITVLEDLDPLPHERLKEMLWAIAPERNRDQWEQRKDTDFAHETAEARFRVNVFADRSGIGSVMRQIPAKILTAEDMGLSKHILDLCFLTKGLVLVTGPTGSGKSTTLAAMIDYVNRHREDHIITIEDPVEFVHPNKKCLVNQREVGVHTDGFKSALRAALREDPDIVLVGEMRDLETIAIAIETAETGHLVFGTLHTNTAPSTVDRIIDQFPADRQAQIRMMLSESLKGVVSQTLCKKIGGGRAPAQEVLLCPSSVSNLIREGKTFQIPSVMQTARGQGMVTLNDALFELVKAKKVEPKEAYMKSVAKSEFKQLLERGGFKLELAGA
ncbi:MAG TPA: PilT/PilU family type 4a pilus ATPase [Anaeromyxobacteraceae bacterium]|jgi:twitching motility protein PilT|nr:PilT/PilU family type 4a pilus ATPase [Anaeromyxobacteraceae bacterium]